MAANLHTFTPSKIGAPARDAGFGEVRVGSAAWAWVLALGLNYYLAGEIDLLARNDLARAAARTAIRSAAAFDRIVANRLVPPGWRHTVQAVLR